jgi:hypothetical protein
MIMAESNQCPTCKSDRLSVLYFDAKGQPLGGHSQCTECGPRSVEVVQIPDPAMRKKLLEKKAS